MDIRGSWRRHRAKKAGADPLRDTNVAEEEVAVGDVTVNGDDSASKNNATSAVL